MYTLAGIADPVKAGASRETRGTRSTPSLATVRTVVSARRSGLRDSRVAHGAVAGGMPLSRSRRCSPARLVYRSRIVPMTDDRVATLIDTPAGPLEFQDYFVGRGQSDDVLGVTFAGIERATALPDALAAIHEAEAIVIAPSNPIVSVAPILQLPDWARRWRTPAPIVAVSPIVGGQALKGPAAKMLETLGHEVSALGVARSMAAWSTVGSSTRSTAIWCRQSSSWAARAGDRDGDGRRRGPAAAGARGTRLRRTLAPEPAAAR